MIKKVKISKPLTISNLHHLKTRNKLLIRPGYQRESVWTTSQKQLLVDSLFRDIDIPKIYFREIETGGFQFEVVDGQQRLTAIFEFLDDKFAMPDDADAVNGFQIRNRKFSKLDTDLAMEFNNFTLDVVTYNTAFSDEDIEETFLRLQNGTPLNAPEKRRAMPGTMPDIVAELANHKAFGYCGFSNKRYAYEDQAAKLIHLMLKGEIADLKLASLKNTYKTHTNLDPEDRAVRRSRQALDFLRKAFSKTANPKLKKYAFLSLSFLTSELLETYNLSNYPKEFGSAYLEFERLRIENEEKSEEVQDPKLAAFTDAARSDLLPHVQYRHEELRRRILLSLQDLVFKDNQRRFSEEQRLAIFLRDAGVCQLCKVKVDQDTFEADHVVAHSRGGKTALKNGQLLCRDCNAKKSAQ